MRLNPRQMCEFLREARTPSVVRGLRRARWGLTIVVKQAWFASCVRHREMQRVDAVDPTRFVTRVALL